jgi:hypothetical protein
MSGCRTETAQKVPILGECDNAALGYIVAQIHDIESRLKIFEQRILSLAKEARFAGG